MPRTSSRHFACGQLVHVILLTPKLRWFHMKEHSQKRILSKSRSPNRNSVWATAWNITRWSAAKAMFASILWTEDPKWSAKVLGESCCQNASNELWLAHFWHLVREWGRNNVFLDHLWVCNSVGWKILTPGTQLFRFYISRRSNYVYWVIYNFGLQVELSTLKGFKGATIWLQVELIPTYGE